MIQNYTNFLDGMDSQVSPFLMADNKLKVLDNCLISQKLGAIVKRLGSKRVSTVLQANKSILGLHNFRQDASTQKMIATVDDATSDDTQLFYKTAAGNWIEIAAAETAWANKANIKVEMEDFIKHCFIVGHGSTDGFLPVATLTGTTFSTSTNLTNAPQGKFIKRYRDRLYIANCYYGGTAYPYRVRISPAVTAEALGDWDYTDNYINVDFSEEITGLGENWDQLLIFTEYSAYKYDQVQKKKVWDVGCSNHRTIKNAGALMIWANRDGVWASTGGRPQNIAGRIIDFIKYATPTDFFAEVIDEEYHLYVGNVTVDGVSYSNCEVIFNIPTSTWRIEEHYNTLTHFARYNSSGKDRLYMGTSNGYVLDKSKYTDDSPSYADHYVSAADTGKPIHAWFVTKPYDFGAPKDEKIINFITAYAERAGALKLRARAITKNSRITDKPIPIGMLKKYINDFSLLKEPIKGNLIQFEGSENSKNPYFSFFGLTLNVDQGSNKR